MKNVKNTRSKTLKFIPLPPFLPDNLLIVPGAIRTENHWSANADNRVPGSFEFDHEGLLTIAIPQWNASHKPKLIYSRMAAR